MSTPTEKPALLPLQPITEYQANRIMDTVCAMTLEGHEQTEINQRRGNLIHNARKINDATTSEWRITAPSTIINVRQAAAPGGFFAWLLSLGKGR